MKNSMHPSQTRLKIKTKDSVSIKEISRRLRKSLMMSLETSTMVTSKHLVASWEEVEVVVAVVTTPRVVKTNNLLLKSRTSIEPTTISTASSPTP
jgi:hypothetical protein